MPILELATGVRGAECARGVTQNVDIGTITKTRRSRKCERGHIFMYVFTYFVYIYIYIYIYVYVCVHMRTYVYIYIYDDNVCLLDVQILTF